MSSTANHKKAIHITRISRQNKGLLLDIYFKICEDQPSAVVNAYEKLKAEHKTCPTFCGSGKNSPWGEKNIRIEPIEYTCPDCKQTVSAIGLGGACGICDPRGMVDVPY